MPGVEHLVRTWAVIFMMQQILMELAGAGGAGMHKAESFLALTELTVYQSDQLSSPVRA